MIGFTSSRFKKKLAIIYDKDDSAAIKANFGIVITKDESVAINGINFVKENATQPVIKVANNILKNAFQNSLSRIL